MGPRRFRREEGRGGGKTGLVRRIEENDSYRIKAISCLCPILDAGKMEGYICFLQQIPQ